MVTKSKTPFLPFRALLFSLIIVFLLASPIVLLLCQFNAFWQQAIRDIPVDEKSFTIHERARISVLFSQRFSHLDSRDWADAWTVYLINDIDRLGLSKWNIIPTYQRRKLLAWYIETIIPDEEKFIMILGRMPFTSNNDLSGYGFRNGLKQMFGEKSWSDEEMKKRLEMGISPSRYNMHPKGRP